MDYKYSFEYLYLFSYLTAFAIWHDSYNFVLIENLNKK